jgi:TonB family protein
MAIRRFKSRPPRIVIVSLVAAVLLVSSPFQAHAPSLAAAQQRMPRQQRPPGPRPDPSASPPVYTGVPGALSGTVEDQLGGLLPTVLVRLTDDRGNVRTTRATSNATFEFAGLPPGGYAIELTEPGFTRTYENVSIAEGEQLTRLIVLPIDTLEETLHITPNGPRTVAPPRTELERFLAARNATSAPDSGRCASPAPCVTTARKVVDREPRYPVEAASLNVECIIVLDARITRDGLIDNVRPLIAEDESFRDAAVTAVRQWQYEPARLNGVPVDAPLRITVEFSRK